MIPSAVELFILYPATHDMDLFELIKQVYGAGVAVDLPVRVSD